MDRNIARLLGNGLQAVGSSPSLRCNKWQRPCAGVGACNAARADNPWAGRSGTVSLGSAPAIAPGAFQRCQLRSLAAISPTERSMC